MDMITFRSCENSLLIAIGSCEVLYATNQHLEIAMNIKAWIQLQFTKNIFFIVSIRICWIDMSTHFNVS